MYEIKVKVNCVEHDAIHARKVLEQPLKGIEDDGAWTSEDLATKFEKW